FPHSEVALSVVIQLMILPETSGIMFTADPVNGHRYIISIDASYGLGEALVAGLVTPDLYKVDKRTNEILDVKVAEKNIAIRPKQGGGTYQEDLDAELSNTRVLIDEKILALAQLGAKVEAHYGVPQDLEWGYEEGELYLLQTRPITSLFPIPTPDPNDEALHPYVSLSHAQVMTDPIRPMGISIWQLMLPFGKASNLEIYNPFILTAAGRLYLDLTAALRLAIPRKMLPKILTIADELISQSLQQIVMREEFLDRVKRVKGRVYLRQVAHWIIPLLANGISRLLFTNPIGTVDRVVVEIDGYLDEEKEKIAALEPGLPRLKAAHHLLITMFLDVALSLPPYLVAAMLAKKITIKLTKKHADPEDYIKLERGIIGNVATEMDLAVGDLADVARNDPKLIALFGEASGQTIASKIASLPTDNEFKKAWHDYMLRYGMRGPSEIDITRSRWNENPESLIQVIRSNMQNASPGAHRLHHAKLVAAGEAAGERLIQAAQHGLFGALKARIARRMVKVVRNMMPIREHPKYFLVRIMDFAKQVLLESGEILYKDRRIDSVEDVWYMDFHQVMHVIEKPDIKLHELIAQRKSEHARYTHLNPPRVITSDGEIVFAQYAQDLPEGALPGSPVSAGVIEGIARVVKDPNKENLSPGEILVAPFTDPGWTPLFINAAGLVTEVGGLMTHGSVVAREYGIPAVVGVIDATQVIQSGQRIRVNGDIGSVEILV
ncbi:MAG: PEP-utilizing enzyme, partial [Chloroflexota bacterium]